MTGYIVSQKIQTKVNYCIGKMCIFFKYVMLCVTTYSLMTGLESAAETTYELQNLTQWKMSKKYILQ